MTAWRAQIHHIWGTSCMVNEMGNAGQPAGNRTKMAAFNAHLLQPAATTWRYRCEGSGTSTQTGVSSGSEWGPSTTAQCCSQARGLKATESRMPTTSATAW
eukprot:EG_transcript_10644